MTDAFFSVFISMTLPWLSFLYYMLKMTTPDTYITAFFLSNGVTVKLLLPCRADCDHFTCPDQGANESRCQDASCWKQYPVPFCCLICHLLFCLSHLQLCHFKKPLRSNNQVPEQGCLPLPRIKWMISPYKLKDQNQSPFLPCHCLPPGVFKSFLHCLSLLFITYVMALGKVMNRYGRTQSSVPLM